MSNMENFSEQVIRQLTTGDGDDMPAVSLPIHDQKH